MYCIHFSVTRGAIHQWTPGLESPVGLEPLSSGYDRLKTQSMWGALNCQFGGGVHACSVWECKMHVTDSQSSFTRVGGRHELGSTSSRGRVGTVRTSCLLLL